MRNLTAKQKKMLNTWIDSVRTENVVANKGISIEVYNIAHGSPPYVIKNKPVWSLHVDDIDWKTWDEIEMINPTEIHYSNVNQYLEDNVLQGSK